MFGSRQAKKKNPHYIQWIQYPQILYWANDMQTGDEALWRAWRPLLLTVFLFCFLVITHSSQSNMVTRRYTVSALSSCKAETKCCQFFTRRFLQADRRVRGVSQSGTRCPIVLVSLTARFQAPQRGPNAPWNPMNALQWKAVDVYVSSDEIGGKWLSRPRKNSC